MNEASLATQPWQPLVQQMAFRRLLEAFSYPGRQVDLGYPGHAALTVVLATLIDRGTTLSDPQQLIGADDRRRLAALPAPPTEAHYVVMPGAVVADFQPALGSLESPETGATVILAVGKLGSGSQLTASGPGVAVNTPFQVAGVDPQWWTLRERWNAAFPLGVDMILVDGGQVLALPRTARLRANGEN